MEASLNESKISGNDRNVAWDGATMGGQDLQNQVDLAPNQPPCMLPLPCLVPEDSVRW